MKVSLGNILKNMRTLNTNLTQKDIGNKLSIADNTISSYERENSQPDFETIVKFAEICNFEIKIYNKNTKEILKWINENIDPKVYISVMTQYFPTYKANEYPEINRKITKEEYKNIEDYIYDLDIKNRLYARLFRRK